MPNVGDLSVLNSSTVLLGGGAAFVGGWEDVRHFGATNISVTSDVDGTLLLEFSNSDTPGTVIESETKAAPAGVGATIRREIAARFIRVTYTNGATPQGSFCLETLNRYIDVAAVTIRGGTLGAVPIPVATVGSAYTDRSVAITTGGTAQQLMAANAARKACAVVNSMENMEILWVSPVTTAAVQGLGSIPIFPGGMWEPSVAPLGAISVLAPTTGTNVTAWEA